MSEAMDVVKITLKSKKVVILKDLKIAHQEQATQLALKQLGKDAEGLAVGIASQKILIRMLLVEVDGVKLSGTDKENLDKYLKVADYNQVMKVVAQMAGTDEGNEMPTIEVMTSGNE